MGYLNMRKKLIFKVNVIFSEKYKTIFFIIEQITVRVFSYPL